MEFWRKEFPAVGGTGIRRLRTAARILSALLCAALTVGYAVRADAWAAVTLFPSWLWLVPGLLLAGLGWSRSTKRQGAVAALLWVVFLLVFAEEPWSLMRLGSWPTAGWEAVRQRGAALRVVSLNCAGGSASAAAEVEAYRPDIVLLQETPGQKDVERLARWLFGKDGGAIVGPDCAILARGRVEPVALPRSVQMLAVDGRVRLVSGIEVEVISLRLLPPTVRIDLWSPKCWREQATNRRARYEQAAEIGRLIARRPDPLPLIIGGDFNAPAGDRIYRALPRRLRDTFRTAGRGWGNTALNDFAFARIDQVWASAHLRPAAVVARRTQNSDHRMVVCDLLLNKD